MINQKNLAKTQNQVEQAQQQSQNVEQNPLIQKELNLNAQLSQYLLEQTEKTNTLTQDELRMRNVLDNLTQTQRTIDEQISALQGTLVLSRIIQQQKQKLPTNLNIQGLSKQIADLRVQIFDITQKRNELYDILNELYRRPDTYRHALLAEFMSLNGCRMGESIALKFENYTLI